MKLKHICCYLQGSNWPFLLRPFAMVLCKLIQKSSEDLCLRNHSSPALLSQIWKTSEFRLMQSLLVSIKIFLNQRYACGRAFLFIWFLQPETGKDIQNAARWGHAHLPMSCIFASSLAGLFRWFCLGCLWQQVKRECVQIRESSFPMGMYSSTHIMPHCCIWHPSQYHPSSSPVPWSTDRLW